MLWFDVEKRYNTTQTNCTSANSWLWFDVEKRYNTTRALLGYCPLRLWFDVEKRYNTTNCPNLSGKVSCGLM